MLVCGRQRIFLTALVLLPPVGTGCTQTPGDPQAALAALADRWSSWPAAADSAREQATDRLARAAASMAEHDLDGALATLNKVDQGALPAAGRYLRGRILLSLGRHKEAAAALPDSAQGLPDEIFHDACLRRAEALVGAGACDQAAELLADLRTGSDGPAQAFLWTAECALKRNQLDSAIAFLEETLAADPKGRQIDRVATQLSLAQTHQARKEWAAALDLLRELYIYEPTDRRSAEVVERIRLLAGNLGQDDVPLVTWPEAMTRARVLLKRRAYEEAADFLAALGPPSREQARRRADFWHLRGTALYRTRKHYAEAAELLARAAQLGGQHAEADAFFAARALARADRDQAAVRALGRFLKKHPRGRFSAQAAYLRAWLGLRHGFADGRRNMERFLEGPLSQRAPKERAEGLFHLAMDAFTHKRMIEAKARFLEYADLADGRNAMALMRGVYWAARAAAKHGRPDQALMLYRRVIETQPHHYYGQLAALQMLEQGAEPPRPLAPAGPPVEIAPVPLPAAAALYAELGLVQDATRVLRAGEPSWLQHREADLQRVLPWAVRYTVLRDHRRAHRLIAPLWPHVQNAPARGLERAAWDIALARPVRQEVQQASRRFSVDADLVYAIMRKESAFDASVVSKANAIGLMQLLPETAAQMDGVENGASFDWRRLQSPTENVRLGTKYLAGLQRRYPQHPALAIAAYNAGTQQVDSWLARARRRDQDAISFDLFVERIPILQTRNYVRRVLTNWARYRYLGGRQPVTCWSLSL